MRDVVIPSKSLDVIARALARAALAAGPAVMEEYARESGARSKADGSPVTAADERAEEIIREWLDPNGADDADRRGGGGGRGLPPGRRGAILPGRSSGRNARISGAKRRIHHQCRPDRRARPRGRRSLRAGERTPMVRGGVGVFLRSARRRRSARRNPVASIANPFRAASTRRAREPFAWRPRDRGVPGAIADRRTQSRPALRSSFASSRKAMRTSIRASRRRWNGIPRRATRCCARREGSCSTRRRTPRLRQGGARGCETAGFVAWGDASLAREAIVNAS